jgi:membrane protein DedA with SNARE-associated domain
LLGLVTLTGIAGTAFSPYLLVEHPVILVLLSPVGRHVVLAAATVDPILLISVTVFRRLLTSLGSYGLGLIYGDAAVEWVETRHPRLGAFIRFLERLFARWGAPLLVVLPEPTVSVFAGAAGSRLLIFLGSVGLGHVIWVTATYYIGEWISGWTRLLIDFLSEHRVESTAVCVLLVIGYQILARRSAAKKNATPSAPSSERTSPQEDAP